MTVTSDWNHVHFHDAVVRSVEYSAEAVVFQLEDLFVDSKNGECQKVEHLCLPKGSLIFNRPYSVLVRAYDSDTDEWQTLSPPFPHMDAIAEVTIAAENIWEITGFLTDGRWLEWQIQLGEPVSLKTYETITDS